MDVAERKSAILDDIYAQSVGTVIVRSEKKGGTWTGANENLRNRWCASFCWNKPEYDGNQELIRLGCIPIDDAWDGNPEQSEGDGIKKAAKFIPVYWYITGTEKISGVENTADIDIHGIAVDMGVQILYAAAIFALAMVMIKKFRVKES